MTRSGEIDDFSAADELESRLHFPGVRMPSNNTAAAMIVVLDRLENDGLDEQVGISLEGDTLVIDPKNVPTQHIENALRSTQRSVYEIVKAQSMTPVQKTLFQ